MPVIGFLSAGSPDFFEPYILAFRRGLGQVGYEEGRNVAIEFRWARGQYDRLAVLAAELTAKELRSSLLADDGAWLRSYGLRSSRATTSAVCPTFLTASVKRSLETPNLLAQYWT
jgi:hypothetical protein